MARAQSIGIRRRLNALLPPDELDALARRTRFMRRRRKLEPTTMLWTTRARLRGRAYPLARRPSARLRARQRHPSRALELPYPLRPGDRALFCASCSSR